MTSPTLTLHRDGAIAWLVADNAERMNAFTADIWRSVPRLVEQAEQDDAVRVMVLRGKGQRAFSAGADISEFETARTGDGAVAYDALNDAAFTALSSSTKPTIAMIHGYCLGGGLGLAACCDLRLGDDKARFAIPAAKLGIGYNARWVRPLLALASAADVKDILFTGRRIDAREALAMRLLNQIHAADDLEAATRDLAGAIAANAPLSVKASKMVVNELVHHPERADLHKLDRAVQQCFDSEDYAEGRRAFMEKRKPAFRGR